MGASTLLRRARGAWQTASQARREPVRMPRVPVLEPEPVDPSDDGVRRVPRGLKVASEWTWRLLILTAGALVLLWVVIRLKQIVIPIVIALLLAALLMPIQRRLARVLPPLVAAGLTVFGLILVVSATLYLVGAQFASQFDEISAQIAEGIGDLRTWIISTFALDDTDIDEFLSQAQAIIMDLDVGAFAASAGVTIGQILVGMVLALFTLFFFLGRGEMFYAWFIRMLPRHARVKGLVSGGIAWGQLASYTRATVVVAAADGIGIGLGASLLGVPFPLGIAVLTFLGAFVPIVGAFTAGAVAVLLAFVSNGLVNALLMFGVVILVQQIEGNVLHPLFMGRAVRVHPLGIVLAVAGGIQLAGVVGAVIAVPIVAMINAVVQYLLQPDPVDFESPADLITEQQAAQVRAELNRVRAQHGGGDSENLPGAEMTGALPDPAEEPVPDPGEAAHVGADGGSATDRSRAGEAAREGAEPSADTESTAARTTAARTTPPAEKAPRVPDGDPGSAGAGDPGR